MKTIATLLAVLILFGCEKLTNPEVEEVVTDTTSIFNDSITFAVVQAWYDSGTLFMSDARSLPSIQPFSYVDSITSFVADTSAPYPLTKSEGETRIKHKDYSIFHNSWNYPYMQQYRQMTIVEYGELNEYKVLRITNESHFTSGSYGRENKLFVDNGSNLVAVNYWSYYSVNGIKISNAKMNVLIAMSHGFPRAYPHYVYLTLIDLSNNQSAVFKKEL